MADDLAASLRAWRERLEPAAADLETGPRRRTPGLRREEVASLAGISVNYLTRLEQGRARTPSASVVASLGGALRLDAAEHAHLHRLAGLATPVSTNEENGVPPSVRRMLERFGDAPAIVIDPSCTIVARNPLAVAYLGAEVLGRNSARQQFLGSSWVTHEPEEERRFERDLVGDLHRQLARRPGDERVIAVVEELRASSDRFEALWRERPVAALVCSRKTAHHPVVGTITVDCDVLEMAGTELRIIVWSAPVGSADADALALLGRLSEAPRSGEPAPARV